jgi:hypothetical protein
MTLLNPNEIKISFNDTKVILKVIMVLGRTEDFTKLAMKNRLKVTMIMYYGMVNLMPIMLHKASSEYIRAS